MKNLRIYEYVDNTECTIQASRNVVRWHIKAIAQESSSTVQKMNSNGVYTELYARTDVNLMLISS